MSSWQFGKKKKKNKIKNKSMFLLFVRETVLAFCQPKFKGVMSPSIC